MSLVIAVLLVVGFLAFLAVLWGPLLASGKGGAR